MSQHLFNDTDITAIANAIRTKKGTQNTMTITQMPSEIESIPTGGSTDPVAVRFIDFDGTVVQELTQQELTSLTALPSGPDHSEDEIPLTFDEWNWLLADIKTFRTANPNWTVNVGANYHTTDGKTHLIYDIKEDGCKINLYIYSTSGTATIDWGDGTVEEFPKSGTLVHTYENSGRYHLIYEGNISQTLYIGSTGNTSTDWLTDVRESSTISVNIISPQKYNLVSYSMPSSHSTLLTHGIYKLKWISLPRAYPNFTVNGQSYNIKYQPMLYNQSVTSYSIEHYHEIEEIYLPDSVTQITYLDYNTKLKRLRLSNSLTAIPNYCFRNDNNLEETNIPSGVTTIGNNAFNGCQGLKKVTFPNTVTTFGTSMCYNCYSLEEVNIPNSITTLPQSCFNGCISLTEIEIPESVTTINNQVFNGCNLLILTMKSTTPPTLSSANGVSSVLRIVVPWSSDHSVLEAYKTANNWSNSQVVSKIIEAPEPTE